MSLVTIVATFSSQLHYWRDYFFTLSTSLEHRLLQSKYNPGQNILVKI